MRWENIKFVSFNDFYKNRKIIRYYYRELTLNEKWSYKRFIYSNELNIKESDKDCIWNFLNENENCNKDLQKRLLWKKELEKRKLKKDSGYYKKILNFED